MEDRKRNVPYPAKPGVEFRTQLWPWRATSLCGVCHADDAGIFGGPGAAAVLCLVPSGLAEAREQAPAVGADARIVLYLCLDVHAPAVRSPLVWFQEVEPPRDDRFHVMSPPSLRLSRFSMRQGIHVAG